jgi:tetratricopeptide (TPR) repeat protein
MDGLPADRVQAALDELLGWPPLARSPQLAKFLSYIVSATLGGDGANIKAYSIAVDVFGRPPSFDPQNDPIVRVQARRLRALLDQFYDEGLARAGVRIHLPVGRYVPEFFPLEVAADAGVPPPIPPEEPAGNVFSTDSADSARHRSWGSAVRVGIAAGIAVVFFVAAFLLSQFRQPAPEPVIAIPVAPVVMVGVFANLTGTPDLDGFGIALADEVAAMLSPFEDFATRRAGSEPASNQNLDDGEYRLSGVINASPSGVEVTATLLGVGGEAIWTRAFDYPSPGAKSAEAAAAAARGIVREIAPYRGPVHQPGRRWLDDQARPLPAVNIYVCQLTYRLARETGASTHIADALSCVDRLLREQPDLPLALSVDAWLKMRADVDRNLSDSDLPEDLDAYAQQSVRAAALQPESSTIHEHLGAIYNWQRRFDASEQEYVDAIRLNPMNTDARAGYAIALSRAMNWTLGGQQAALAIENTAYPSPWYFYPAGVNALREGRYAEAIEYGRKAMQFAGGEIGATIALTGAVNLNLQDVVGEILPRIMNSENLRRVGIAVWLGALVTDPEVLSLITDSLQQAGVPQSALTGPF